MILWPAHVEPRDVQVGCFPRREKKIVCGMENVLYANGILLKDLLIFVEPTSPERSVLVLTRPPLERGNNIVTSEGQSIEVFYDEWRLKKLDVEGKDLK